VKYHADAINLSLVEKHMTIEIPVLKKRGRCVLLKYSIYGT
jgi:hypothetical protein